ncbi:MAG: hypothetical protein ABIE94_01795 [archaeon]
MSAWKLTDILGHKWRDGKIADLRRSLNDRNRQIVALERDLGYFGTEPPTLLQVAFRYLTQGRIDEAEETFDRLFQVAGLDSIVAYVFHSPFMAENYFLKPQVQDDLKFVRKLVIKNFFEEVAAEKYDVVANHYNNIAGRIRGRIPQTTQVGKYVLEEEIVGPDGHIFFSLLDSFDGEETEFAQRLKSDLTNCWIEDAAFLQAHQFPFKEGDCIYPEYDRKFIEALELVAKKDGDLMAKVTCLSDRLGASRKVCFADRAPWNGMVNIPRILEFLSGLPGPRVSLPTITEVVAAPEYFENVIHKIVSYAQLHPEQQGTITDVFRRNLYHIDFGTCNRLTFPEDDFIHATEMPVVYNPAKTDDRQQIFLSMLEENDQDTSNLFVDYALKRLYRHLRVVFLYAHSTKADVYGDNVPFHLEMACQAAAQLVSQTTGERSFIDMSIEPGEQIAGLIKSIRHEAL